MTEKEMPDFEQTLKFYEDLEPHIETQLDDDQHFEFICMCVSGYFKKRSFDMGTLMRYTSALQIHAIHSTFQPSAESREEKIDYIVVRLKELCKKFLTRDESEEATLWAFLHCVDADHELCPAVKGYLERISDS